MEAPERVWLDPDLIAKPRRVVAANFATAYKHRALPTDAEYVRADIHATLAARLAEVERELERWRELRPTIASLCGYSPDWPSHGNAPLAIAAGWSLLQREISAAEARAERLEAALRGAEPYVTSARDCGPPDEGWQSDELQALCAQISAALQQEVGE